MTQIQQLLYWNVDQQIFPVPWCDQFPPSDWIHLCHHYHFHSVSSEALLKIQNPSAHSCGWMNSRFQGQLEQVWTAWHSPPPAHEGDTSSEDILTQGCHLCCGRGGWSATAGWTDCWNSGQSPGQESLHASFPSLPFPSVSNPFFSPCSEISQSLVTLLFWHLSGYFYFELLYCCYLLLLFQNLGCTHLLKIIIID